MIAVACLAVLPAKMVAAHCEVPCGIYGDQARFVEMLENTDTIAKAIDSVHELAKDHTPQVINQAIRWTNTKEEHATATQHIIAQYFMTQRLKPDADKYTEKITLLHRILLEAMKCKQTTDVAHIETIRSLLKKFEVLYFGRNLH